MTSAPHIFHRAFAALILSLTLLAAAPPAVAAAKILASTAALADIVAAVAGEDARVIALYPGGVHPRLAAPERGVLREADSCDLYVKVGSGLEGRSVLGPDGKTARLPILDLSDGRRLLEESVPEKAERKIFSAALGVDLDNGGEGKNPFFWLDPAAMREAVEPIADALSDLLPEKAGAFRRRAALLEQRLEALHRETAESLEGIGERRLVVFTGAWSYFAARYGLKEIPVSAVRPGGGPGRQSLKGAVAGIRTLEVPAVFTDLTFPFRPAETAARRAGVRLVVLEPFGSPANSGYFELIRRNTRLIEEALR
jgi:zinc transport system substrate-binding protein